MSYPRDADIPGYPLPVDPVTGMGWWRFSLVLCVLSKGWREWQRTRRMDAIVPALRWRLYGAVPIDGNVIA